MLPDLPVDQQSRVLAAAAAAATTTTDLNFARAAIVLQNSSLVYSRKVEYLHSLVYKALEEFAATAGGRNKRRNGASPRGQRSSAFDAEVEEFFNSTEDNQEFLLLDDVVPEDKTENNAKINLRDAGSDDPAAAGGGYRRSGSSSSSLRTSLSRSRLSLTGLTAATDRTASSISSGGGPMMTEAQHRALTGTLSETCLRLVDAHSNIDRTSGSLLMPGVSAGVESDGGAHAHRNLAGPSFQNDDNGGDSGFIGSAGGGFDDGDDDDHDNDGAGFMMMADDDNGDDPPENGADVAVSEGLVAEAAHAPEKRVTFADPPPDAADEEEYDDPWEMWDPHSSDGTKERPLRIGNTLRLPPGVNELPSECVTGARTKLAARQKAWRQTQDVSASQQALSSSLAAETFKATVAAARKRRMDHEDPSSLLSEAGDGDNDGSVFPSISLKGLAFGEEFAYIAKETSKRRAAERRALRKQQQEQQRHQRQAASVDDDATAAAAPLSGDGYNDDDDDGGGYAFGGFDDGIDDDDDDYGFHNHADGDQGRVMGNTGMASLDDAYKGSAEGEFVCLLQKRNFFCCHFVRTRLTFLDETLFLALFTLQMPTKMPGQQPAPRHSKSFVGHTFRHSPRAPRSTRLKRIYPSAFVIGRTALDPFSRRRSDGESSISTLTVIA